MSHELEELRVPIRGGDDDGSSWRMGLSPSVGNPGFLFLPRAGVSLGREGGGTSPWRSMVAPHSELVRMGGELRKTSSFLSSPNE